MDSKKSKKGRYGFFHQIKEGGWEKGKNLFLKQRKRKGHFQVLMIWLFFLGLVHSGVNTRSASRSTGDPENLWSVKKETNDTWCSEDKFDLNKRIFKK